MTTRMNRIRSVLIAAAGVVALSSCSIGGSPAIEERRDDATKVTNDLGTAEGRSDDAVGEEPADLHPLTFLLPLESTLPSGWAAYPTSCDATSDSPSYPTFGIGHPAQWQVRSAGMGGSSGTLYANISLRFDTGVAVELNDPSDDQVADSPDKRNPFDGEWSLSGTDIENQEGVRLYDVATTVQIGDSSVAVYHQASGQDLPEMIDEPGVYKALVPVVEVPAPYSDPNYRTQYKIAIVTLPGEMQDDVALAADLIGSLSVPDCVQQDFTNTQEMTLGADLDGDGRTYSKQDALQELSDLFDEAYCEEKDLPADLCEQYREMFAGIDEGE